MQHLHILNSREVKNFQKQLEEQFGWSPAKDHAFLKSNKDKVYIVSKDIANLKYEELRVESVGIYFAQIEKDGVRLSIEGSQIVGPHATQNIIELDDEQFKQWFKGYQIPVEDERRGWLLVKHKNDFFGAAKIAYSELMNFVPKSRRITGDML